MGLRRPAWEFPTRFIALFLCVGVVRRIAISSHLRGEGGVTIGVEFSGAELGSDSGFGQSRCEAEHHSVSVWRCGADRYARAAGGPAALADRSLRRRLRITPPSAATAAS